jgi:hypothetical protein
MYCSILDFEASLARVLDFPLEIHDQYHISFSMIITIYRDHCHISFSS